MQPSGEPPEYPPRKVSNQTFRGGFSGGSPEGRVDPSSKFAPKAILEGSEWTIHCVVSGKSCLRWCFNRFKILPGKFGSSGTKLFGEDLKVLRMVWGTVGCPNVLEFGCCGDSRKPLACLSLDIRFKMRVGCRNLKFNDFELKSGIFQIFGVPLTPLSLHGKICSGGVRRQATPENVAPSMCCQSLKIWWQSENSKWSKNQDPKKRKNCDLHKGFINKVKTA